MRTDSLSGSIRKTVKLRKSKAAMYHTETEFMIPYKRDKKGCE